MDHEKFPDKQFNEGFEYGIIAQQLEEFFPLLVKTNDDGFKSIDYVKLSVVLLKGVQEQEKQISFQDQELQQPRKEMDEMKVILQKLME